MDLLDLVRRNAAPPPWPEPWEGSEKIPWDEPGFSGRMLEEHVSQDHDAASRRIEIIETHVRWIHETLLSGAPSKILDLGCGPGLYANRLAALGHDCLGIDFSPASIDYARRQADRDGLRCEFLLGDIRQADYGAGYGLAMLIFGEFNAFRRADAHVILGKAREALSSGGVLLLEAHTFDAVRAKGEQPPSWYSRESGLFSDRPHVCLKECFWHPEHAAATERWLIVDAESADVTRHAQSMQAYTDDDYRSLLAESGFDDVEFHPSMGETADAYQAGLVATTCRKSDAA